MRALRPVLPLCVFALLVGWGCSEDPPSSVFGDADAGGYTGTFGEDIDGGGLFPPPPPVIVAVPKCGNAIVDPGEGCDDGNTSPNDGCGGSCQLEPGWNCGVIGAACKADACGDGVVAGDEDCDDGNIVAGDGCSPVCVLERGYACPDPGKPCVTTTCGDGKREGTEQCDDGNTRPYDGCSPDCTREPSCAGGTCTAICGDGSKFPGEACDDGNGRSGDGCSANCTLEPGFSCAVTSSGLPASIDIPIVYRDFTPATHPDFEKFSGSAATTGLVKPTLGPTGFPEFLSDTGSGVYGKQLTSAADFAAWWAEDPSIEKTIFAGRTLTFNRQPDDSYVFDSSAFFPLDGQGWGNYNSTGHNFHFTSELRYWFTFKGGEVLDFRGDDDVWVFVNGKLAVDLGGLHPATAGSVTLDATKAAELGLVVGGMYEFDLFQAERHTNQSNYKLTLRGFVNEKTTCTPVCGDGIKTKGEACDDGVNAGGYGKCAPGCVLGPRCGDGVVQADAGEVCDDGNRVDGDGCSASCKQVNSQPR